MPTRCKISCIKTDEILAPDYSAPKNLDGSYPSVEGQSAQFMAAYDSDPKTENGQFFLATPSLMLTVATTRGRPFETGKYYYLDFAEVAPSKTSAG